MKKRYFLPVLAIAVFIVASFSTLSFTSNQITERYLATSGEEAMGYATMAAASTHLSDEQVEKLKKYSYAELLDSEENKEFYSLFKNHIGSAAVEYAYVMLKLDDSEVKYHVTAESAESYDAPVGTPFDLMWLLDVNPTSNEATSLDTEGEDALNDPLARYGYWNDQDDKIFSEAPLYIVNDDEWGQHIAGYAPLYSEEGALIGIVGVDLATSNYEQSVASAFTALFILFTVIIIAAVLVFVAVLFNVRRTNREKRLQDERYQLLIDTTDTLILDYDPHTDTLVHSYIKPDGTLGERTITDYLKNIKDQSQIDPDQVESISDEIEKSLELSRTTSTAFRVDLGGGPRWYKATYASVADEFGHVYRVIGRMDDAETEKAIERRADYDSLSGVMTRAAAEERIGKMPATKHFDAAFMLLDIDDFKRINDTMGHTEGDHVIASVGGILQTVFRESDVAYRLGGDEFAIYLLASDAASVAEMKAEMILSRVKALSEELDWDFEVSVSIGVATTADPDIDQEHLYRMADGALYDAKDKGKGCYSVAND